jgi:hypothetical protein
LRAEALDGQDQFAAISVCFSQETLIPGCPSRYTTVEGPIVNPLKHVMHSFIFTFGITPPRPQEERIATIFVSTLLAGTVLLIIGFGVLMLRQIF